MQWLNSAAPSSGAAAVIITYPEYVNNNVAFKIIPAYGLQSLLLPMTSSTHHTLLLAQLWYWTHSSCKVHTGVIAPAPAQGPPAKVSSASFAEISVVLCTINIFIANNGPSPVLSGSNELFFNFYFKPVTRVFVTFMCLTLPLVAGDDTWPEGKLAVQSSLQLLCVNVPHWITTIRIHNDTAS